MREISEKECGTLKGVTGRALKTAGGAAEVQNSTRVNEATLSKYASTSEENEKSFVPIDIAIEIDRLAQSPILLTAFAKAEGYDIAPLDPCENSGMKPLTIRDALIIANKAADVVKAITEALSNDDRIDLAEERIITREIDEVMQVMHGALCRLKVRT